jgi:UDP-glucose 4-epimerase
VPSSSSGELRNETRLFGRVVTELIPNLDCSALTVVLASSAGALHSMSQTSLIDASTPPNAWGAYGNHKLEQEALLEACARRTGIYAVAARITNVYGPGQSLAKAQGLITRLCITAATRTITSIFVPLDTQRDFVYADDAATQLLELAGAARVPGLRDVGIVASGESVSLHRVIAAVGNVGPGIRLLLNCLPTASPATGHCRFVPTAAGARGRARTLESGVHATWRDVLGRLRSGEIAQAVAT